MLRRHLCDLWMVYALAYLHMDWDLDISLVKETKTCFFCLFFNQIGLICCSFQHMWYRFLCYFRSRAVLPHHFSSLVTFTILATRNFPHNSNSQPCVCVYQLWLWPPHVQGSTVAGWWSTAQRRESVGWVFGDGGWGSGSCSLCSHRCEVNRVVPEETSSALVGSQGSSLDKAPQHWSAPGQPHPTSMCQATQHFCTPPQPSWLPEGPGDSKLKYPEKYLLKSPFWRHPFLFLRSHLWCSFVIFLGFLSSLSILGLIITSFTRICR